ncbi:MAG: hypothetical protein US30_C0001G0040 [Candidatus Moranbacteria bacterium GW2011_GWF2_36_839]|nr:MAG: hypothetical protein US27_C0001G0040 [Candidatus Moranbacteria bacterium GW2011_GWF1_36_78]KKQ17706.1 MAG: hypothetical protein US30_C0001G0040 [Candidatus Moranbacteria bacterium GW2011_GWF2_36_839]HAT73408.1 hypothetical protein [Candidatus Moranbacteria bacterium]HBY10771.1 hypothetical protein [Candidatus Moranbacteria bacterium]
MSQQKKIIFFLIILFIASSVWLFYLSEKILDPNVGKNWWSVSFSDSKSEDLDFTIENHSDKDNFQWIVLSGNDKINEANVTVKKGENYFANVNFEDNYRNKKITIQVISGDEKKEIYKNL